MMKRDPHKDPSFQSRTLRWLAKEQIDRDNTEKAMQLVEMSIEVNFRYINIRRQIL